MDNETPVDELTLFAENGVIVKVYAYGNGELGIRAYNGFVSGDKNVNIGGLLSLNERRKLKDWLGR